MHQDGDRTIFAVETGAPESIVEVVERPAGARVRIDAHTVRPDVVGVAREVDVDKGRDSVEDIEGVLPVAFEVVCRDRRLT